MARRSSLLLGACLVAAFAWPRAAPRADETPGQAAKGPNPPAKPAFVKDVAPLLAKYCVTCHGGKRPKGDLALDQFKTEQDARQQAKLWEKVVLNLRSGEMPPVGKPRPPAAESDRLL